MKRIFLLIFFGLNAILASAQMETLFYGEPFSSKEVFIEAVRSSIPASYSSRFNDSTKSGDYFFSFKDSASHEVSIYIHKSFTGHADVMKEVKIAGELSILFNIWKLYFDKEAYLNKIKKDLHAVHFDEAKNMVSFDKLSGNTWYIH